MKLNRIIQRLSSIFFAFTFVFITVLYSAGAFDFTFIPRPNKNPSDTDTAPPEDSGDSSGSDSVNTGDPPVNNVITAEKFIAGLPGMKGGISAGWG